MLFRSPYGTVRCRTVPYGAVQCRTVPYGTVRYRAVPYGTVRFRTVRCGTVRYRALPYGTVWHPSASAHATPPPAIIPKSQTHLRLKGSVQESARSTLIRNSFSVADIRYHLLRIRESPQNHKHMLRYVWPENSSSNLVRPKITPSFVFCLSMVFFVCAYEPHPLRPPLSCPSGPDTFGPRCLHPPPGNSKNTIGESVAWGIT